MSEEWFEADLREQQSIDRLRTPRTLHYQSNTHATLDGRAVVVFCSNDYLGLRNDEHIRRAGEDALRTQCAGSGASRLVSGDLPLFVEAEQAFAEFVGRETSLLFTSGFAANAGIIPALVGAEDVLFSDALNHASMVDGCRLARARTVVYPHADAAALERLIDSARPFRRGWILTESVFSMDGDVAPLIELRAVADRQGLALYVDDAHAIGVFGPQGRGCVAESGIRTDVLIGTLGKSLGGAGAFAAGSKAMRLWLWNRARTFVFSTGTTAANAAMAREAIRVVAARGDLIAQLHRNTDRLRRGLLEAGVAVLGHPQSPILPIVLGAERQALEVSRALLERGYFVSAIRPPTVPRGTSRLRITVAATHTDDEIDGLLAAVRDCLR